MYDRIYKPGDENESWYPAHREEWGWLVDHGDPQTDTFHLLTPIALRDVPAVIREEAWMEIEEGIEVAEGEDSVRS